MSTIKATVKFSRARLCEALRDQKWSVAKLCLETGVSRTTLGRMLNGSQARTSASHLQLVADALDVSCRWLRGAEVKHGYWDSKRAAAVTERTAKRLAGKRDPDLEEGVWGDRMEAFLGGRKAMARRRAAKITERCHEDPTPARAVRVVVKTLGSAGRAYIGSFDPGHGRGHVQMRALPFHSETDAKAKLKYLDKCQQLWLEGNDLPEIPLEWKPPLRRQTERTHRAS